MANITITNEKFGAIVLGTENIKLALECTLNGDSFSKTLIWKQNGRPVAVGRNGSVLYYFIPRKKDHLSEFCCQVYETRFESTIEKVITLNIRCKLNYCFVIGVKVLLDYVACSDKYSVNVKYNFSSIKALKCMFLKWYSGLIKTQNMRTQQR